MWITWLCGDVQTISAFKGRVGDLDADIDDVYQLILRFKPGCLGHLQVDVLQRAGYRQTRFVCSEGVISWDWDARKLLVHMADGSWREHPESFSHESAEGFYIDEMAAFLAAIRGEQPWPHTLSDDRRIIGLLNAAERSDELGRHISVDE